MTRTTLLALAERVEAATGADRELGARVIAASLAPANAFVEQSKINGAWCIYTADADGKNRSWQPPRGVRGDDRCPTASLDAAMSLPPSGQAQEVLRHAMAALGKRFDLHIKFWPKDQNYTEWLARFVTAASLRAIAGSLPND